MHGDGRRRRWAGLAVLALLLVVGTVVGITAYNAGVAHGLAIGAQAVNLEQGARAAVPAPGYGYGYGWHPWGFGFGFLTPLFFIVFWLFVARMLFWRGWARCGGHGPGRYRGRGFPGGGPHDGPRDFYV